MEVRFKSTSRFESRLIFVPKPTLFDTEPNNYFSLEVISFKSSASNSKDENQKSSYKTFPSSIYCDAMLLYRFYRLAISNTN